MANMCPNKNPMPHQDPVVRSGNFQEVALGYTKEQAVDEAQRCLNCKNMPCVSGCPVKIRIPEFIAKRRTKRIFALNLKTKKFWSEEEQRFVTLKVSCKGMRIIEKNGLDATIKDAQNKGFINLV